MHNIYRAGAIAGAISMGLGRTLAALFDDAVCCVYNFAGEFIATKSQNEVLEADIKLERDEHFKFHREVEEMQVCFIVRDRPLALPLKRRCANCSPSLEWPAHYWTRWSRASAAAMTRCCHSCARLIFELLFQVLRTRLSSFLQVEFGEEEGKDRNPVVTALISCR